MAKFNEAETKVFGVSTDNTPSQREFAAKNNVTFPLLSDFAKRQVAAAYGVLSQEAGVANRSTFIVDKEGKIRYMDIHPIGDQPKNSVLFEELKKIQG